MRSSDDAVRTYSTPEAARLASVTYRQLDHWARQGVLAPARPANGSGTQRRYEPEQVRAAAVLGNLAMLGARQAALAATAADLGQHSWRGAIVVHPLGRVVPLEAWTSAGHGWLIDLDACRVDQRPLDA